MTKALDTAIDLWRDTTKPVSEISEMTGLSVSTIRNSTRGIVRPGRATRRKTVQQGEISPLHVLIGEEIRKTRLLERGWNMTNLSESTGLGVVRLASIEQGKVDIRLSELDNILSALGVEVDISVRITDDRDND